MKKVLLFISMLLAAVLITSLYSCTQDGGENDNRHRREGNSEAELPPGVHVYYGNNKDKFKIEEVKDDDTLILSGDTANIPRVDEIIVAGITDKTPYGLLCRVDEVIYDINNTILRTSPAYINEVLPNNKFEVKIPADQLEVDYAIDVFGNKIVPSTTRGEDGLNLPITYKLYWNPYEGEIQSGWLQGWDYKVALGLDLTGTLGLTMTFYYESEEGWVDRIGVICDNKAKLDLTAKVVGSLSYEFPEKLLYTYWLKPIVVMLGYVPVVFTPAFQIYWLNELKGELKLSCKLFSMSEKTVETVEYNRLGDPNTGEHFLYNCVYEPLEVEGDTSSPLDYIQDLSPKITLSGEYKTTIRTELNVSLYGANKWDRLSLANDLFAKLKAEFSLSPFDDEETHKESIGIYVGMDFLPEAKAEFKNPFNKKTYGGKWDDLKLHVFEKEVFSLFALTNTFDDLRVYGDLSQSYKKDAELTANDNIIHIKATMTKPDFQLFADEDFGFCVGIDDTNEEIREKTWAFYGMKEKYVNYSQKTDLSLELPAKDFEASTKYYVRPFVKLKNGNIVYSKRGSFITYGYTADNGGTVNDVPGEDF